MKEKVIKKGNRKNIIILILTLVIIFLAVTSLLKINDNVKAKQIIKDSLTAQSIISTYIGKMKSDTFDIYTTEQLLIGSTDIKNIVETKIKNNNDEDLLQIVSLEDKVSNKNSTFYKINIDSFEKKFDVNLYKEDGITWYVQNTGNIKINYTIKPNWWTQELNAIYLGD